MLLADQVAIREIIAFPLNQQGGPLDERPGQCARQAAAEGAAHPHRAPIKV
ncbi:hypothetical protein ACRAWD_00030 [Caulobacter segnis]